MESSFSRFSFFFIFSLSLELFLFLEKLHFVYTRNKRKKWLLHWTKGKQSTIFSVFCFVSYIWWILMDFFFCFCFCFLHSLFKLHCISCYSFFYSIFLPNARNTLHKYYSFLLRLFWLPFMKEKMKNDNDPISIKYPLFYSSSLSSLFGASLFLK